MPDPAFQLHGATCRFGELIALDRISLSINQGEQVALIGPSGSGKTTLLRLLNTMRAPDRGRVSVYGIDPVECGAVQLRKLRSRIATIPQDLGLVASLSVVQNVILGKGGHRSTIRSLRDLVIPTQEDLAKIHQILDRVGIEEKLYSRTADLSGGQQQRVAIARALFQEPDAIFADEPVSSVDPTRARDTVKLLGELSRENGFALCVSLHNLGLARELFPRLVGLRGGKITVQGAPEELSNDELEGLYRLSKEEMMKDA